MSPSISTLNVKLMTVIMQPCIGKFRFAFKSSWIFNSHHRWSCRFPPGWQGEAGIEEPAWSSALRHSWTLRDGCPDHGEEHSDHSPNEKNMLGLHKTLHPPLKRIESTFLKRRSPIYDVRSKWCMLPPTVKITLWCNLLSSCRHDACVDYGM